MTKPELEQSKSLVLQALHEDLQKIGDITSQAIVDPKRNAEAYIVAKEYGVLAGAELAKLTFKMLDEKVRITFLLRDGAKIRKGQKVARITGSAWAILAGERTALNFLQRFSGIATLTSSFVKVAGKKIQILDTRKTTPGMRILEKYAVRCGGGKNHRQGLFDQILIKDNHIEIAGSISEALSRVNDFKIGKKLKVEIECQTIAQVKEALLFRPEIIMLDNMTNIQIKNAVSLIRKESKRTKIEVSGGINLKRIVSLKKIDLDYISVGALTHSVKALDLSLKMKS